MGTITPIGSQSRLLDLALTQGAARMVEVQNLVAEGVERLEKQSAILQRRQSDLTDIKFDDPRFTRRMGAEVGLVSVERVGEIWQEVSEPDRISMNREHALGTKAYAQSTALRYITIRNARWNTIHLLADDVATARYIAHNAGRISARTNGNVTVYDTVGLSKLPNKVAIEAAIAAGYPGEIEFMGNKVVHPRRKLVFG